MGRWPIIWHNFLLKNAWKWKIIGLRGIRHWLVNLVSEHWSQKLLLFGAQLHLQRRRGTKLRSFDYFLSIMNKNKNLMVPEVTPEAELLPDYKFCTLGRVNICGRQQRCSKAVTAFKSTLLLPMRSHPAFQTGFTLAHMTYLLAKNPDKQEALYEELRRELPPGQPVTHEMLGRNLKYLRATLREVNRSVPQSYPQRGQQVSTPGLA